MTTKQQRIGVIGAGMMGSEIALTFGLADHEVLLSDAAEERLAAATKNISTILDKGAARGFWSQKDAKRAIGQIRTTSNLADYANCDVVIEAVSEDEPVKSTLFRQLDKICRHDSIIASNTSSISITVLSSYLSPARRANFIGTYFFSPVSRMKLVEVIPGLDRMRERSKLQRHSVSRPVKRRSRSRTSWDLRSTAYCMRCSSRRPVWRKRALPIRRISISPANSDLAIRSDHSNSWILSATRSLCRCRKCCLRPMAIGFVLNAVEEDGQGRLRRSKNWSRVAALGEESALISLASMSVEVMT